MKEVVYIVGAGLNQYVKDRVGDSPPMLNNLFKIALGKKKDIIFRENDNTKLMLDFIERYFKKDGAKLAAEQLDLERCFSFLEHQINAAKNENNELEFQKLCDIHTTMISVLGATLNHFEKFASESKTLRRLGELMLRENPTIITFNYDTILERILELSSGPELNIPEEFGIRTSGTNGLSDALLIYSHYKWNRPLAYGIKFDEVQLHQAGMGGMVEGVRFYSPAKNCPYQKPLLKLHGSLNWFVYTRKRNRPIWPDVSEPSGQNHEGNIIVKKEEWWMGSEHENQGWVLSPLVIPPVTERNRFYYSNPYKELWGLAEKAISSCSKMVIVGYSFPPTDFSTQALLIKALQNNNLKELVIVNPDINCAKVATELCHFERGVTWYSCLNDYLHDLSAQVEKEKTEWERPITCPKI